MFTRQTTGLRASKRWLYLTLAGVILATLPCYCAGIAAIQNAPGNEPTATATEDISTPAEPEATTAVPLPTETGDPGTPTASATPTGTRFIPPTATETYTPSPSPTATETFTPEPTITNTPVPASTNTPVPPDPTDTPDVPPPTADGG